MPNFENILLDSLIYSGIRSEYWGRLSRRYGQIDSALKIFLAITAPGAVATWQIWAENPLIWQVLTGLSGVMLTILPVVNLNHKKAGTSRLSTRWFQIFNNYEKIYISSAYKDEQEMITDHGTIRDREAEIKNDENDFTIYKSLHLKCENHIKEKYADF